LTQPWAVQARLNSNRAWMLNQTIRQLLDNACNRPRDTLADVLAQPAQTVGRDSAAMFPAFWVEKKHQSKANTSNTRADCKTFRHRFSP
jgi:hypothetical protein